MKNTLDSNALMQKTKTDIEILIITGYYKGGDKLPTFEQFAKLHNVSVSTIRAVVKSLYADDTLIRKPSIGYYVKPYCISILKEKYKKLFSSQLKNIVENIKRFDFNIDDIDELRNILKELLK